MLFEILYAMDGIKLQSLKQPDDVPVYGSTHFAVLLYCCLTKVRNYFWDEAGGYAPRTRISSRPLARPPGGSKNVIPN